RTGLDLDGRCDGRVVEDVDRHITYRRLGIGRPRPDLEPIRGPLSDPRLVFGQLCHLATLSRGSWLADHNGGQFRAGIVPYDERLGEVDQLRRDVPLS